MQPEITGQMDVSSSAAGKQLSYLNIVASDRGLSEFRNGKRAIFIPKEQIQRQKDRSCKQFLGWLLSVWVALIFALISEGFAELRWGIGSIVFGSLGGFCLYEAFKKEYHLQAISSNDMRKLIIRGSIQKVELSKFINSATQLGYTFQNGWLDNGLI